MPSSLCLKGVSSKLLWKFSEQRNGVLTAVLLVDEFNQRKTGDSIRKDTPDSSDDMIDLSHLKSMYIKI